jgi:hypothetical protein
MISSHYCYLLCSAIYIMRPILVQTASKHSLNTFYHLINQCTFAAVIFLGLSNDVGYHINYYCYKSHSVTKQTCVLGTSTIFRRHRTRSRKTNLKAFINKQKQVRSSRSGLRSKHSVYSQRTLYYWLREVEIAPRQVN